MWVDGGVRDCGRGCGLGRAGWVYAQVAIACFARLGVEHAGSSCALSQAATAACTCRLHTFRVGPLPAASITHVTADHPPHPLIHHNQPPQSPSLCTHLPIRVSPPVLSSAPSTQSWYMLFMMFSCSQVKSEVLFYTLVSLHKVLPFEYPATAPPPPNCNQVPLNPPAAAGTNRSPPTPITLNFTQIPNEAPPGAAGP